MSGQIEGHQPLATLLFPPRRVGGQHLLDGIAMGEVGNMGNFAGLQRCIEAKLGPDLVADVLIVESAASRSHQGYLGQSGEVCCDRT